MSNGVKNPLIVLSIGAFLVFSIGCGYHLRGSGEPVGIRIQSLGIPLMESTSSNLGFEGDFTSMIIQEFASYAKIPLVPRDEAEAILIGKIVEIKTEPLSYDLFQTTVQGRTTTYEVTNTRRLRVKLDAKLVDRVTGKVLWEDRAMEEKATFVVGTDPLANRHHERKALQEAARRLANMIYLKTMERF